MSTAHRLPFAIVVAADAARGIGRANGLPWKLPTEMAYFKRVTTEAPPGRQNAVIMGRKTYESIPGKFRPLKDRLNVVLSRSTELALDASVRLSPSLDAALALLENEADLHRAFVIGGGSLYGEALRHPQCTRVYITRVHRVFECDTFLSQFEQDFQLTKQDGPHRDGDVEFTFEVYERGAPANERGNA